MNRYIAVLLVLSVPQFASAATVSFGAKLDADGGHAGGSASDTGVGTPVSGRISWAGNGITINKGTLYGPVIMLEGIVTRTRDESLADQPVTVFLFVDSNTILMSVGGGGSYLGVGHVNVR